ncbi:left-right determination factor 2-like isoform X2 [Delphinapterus leucas]|uniref:Left-right determination factor 2-like isoform X2 n=1 Tax=Delphinapterus leucas TaxID=9749 RepID=A0A2Y9NV45_DELLE|nr:left-right determination factor 2-like isoform X3 [Delphinapterus leucas]XP_022435048.1 left-right determination factor 2-like isoform X2 [Delphinapterus leucas]
MRPLWLCWALWALPLAGPGAALTEERVLGSLLRQLRLSEAPVLDEADVERLIIPAHVRAQYVALLQRSHGARSRGKRFSQNFREVAGRFLVSEAALRSHERLFPRSDRARITVQWLHVRDDGSNRTSLIDSRLVSIHESGWKALDVTDAVNFWQQLRRPRQSLLLQVSVQREHLGPLASSAHTLVRFASQGPSGAGQREPQLELHTLDLRDYGAQGNCDPKAPATEGTRCCRREVYIDLQGMKWAENWVLEPPGFLAYECVGTCQQPPESLTFKWPFLGPRQCIASETTSLPMIVSIPEGGKPRPQVVSLPNMRVQKCSCASDGAPVPRKLEP